MYAENEKKTTVTLTVMILAIVVSILMVNQKVQSKAKFNNMKQNLI